MMHAPRTILCHRAIRASEAERLLMAAHDCDIRRFMGAPVGKSRPPVIPVPRPNLIAGMEHRARLAAARRAAGADHADHQQACPVCQSWGPCPIRDLLREAWEAAIAAEDAARPGAGL